jgi:actin-related protein 6
MGDPPLEGSAAHLPVECLLLIDTGYSHTTVTPLINGRPIQPAIRRLDIGGKFLTNYLKELISIRHFNVTDEPWLVNEIKEATCFVSQAFAKDLERAWKGGQKDRKSIDTSIVVDYVLPDFETRPRGVVKPYDPEAHRKAKSVAGTREPLLTLRNERFSVPELIFNPGDIGMKEAGLPAVVMQSVNALPEGLRPAMLANVVVVGGNSNIPGFMERL